MLSLDGSEVRAVGWGLVGGAPWHRYASALALFLGAATVCLGYEAAAETRLRDMGVGEPLLAGRERGAD